MKSDRTCRVRWALLFRFHSSVTAHTASRTGKGHIDIDGGDQETALKEFVELAGGPDAIIVYIPTAASSLRLPSGLIWEWLTRTNYRLILLSLRLSCARCLGLRHYHSAHEKSKDRQLREFVKPLRSAQGVWISGGKCGPLIRGLSRHIDAARA
jgi:hypothetical protein